MSGYERSNTFLVFVIITMLLLGAILTVLAISFIGEIPFFDPNGENGNEFDNVPIYFDFEQDVVGTEEVVRLDLDIDVGDIKITFVEDPGLLYSINMSVPNKTLIDYGIPPDVNFIGGDIICQYRVCSMDIVLGSNITYEIDINLDVGSVDLLTNESTSISDVYIQVDVGGITLLMPEDTNIVSNITIDLDVDVGNIILSIDLPTGYEGAFIGIVDTGDLYVTTSTWTDIVDSRYYTPNYDTASSSVLVNAIVDVGDIVAILTR